MRELNFCPHCGVQTHKFVILQDGVVFCRSCEGFFNTEQPSLSCPKCSSAYIRVSDYPAPSGELLFQCRRCFNHVRSKELVLK